MERKDRLGPRSRPLHSWLALLSVCFGCSGAIDGQRGSGPDVQGGPPGTWPGAAGSTAPPTAGTGNPAIPGVNPSDPSCMQTRTAPEARAVLLSMRQYVNALRDLLGTAAVSQQDAAAVDALEIEIVDRPWMTTATLDHIVRLAENAAESLRGQTATFLRCSALTDRTCVRNALGGLGRRAYKRPLEVAELDDVMSVYDAGVAAITDDRGESGTLLALQAILAAPSALYRTEFLAPATAAARELTPHERAAAVAVLLLDSLPDEPVLAAADDGSIMTPAGLQAQVDRLLALPRVREHLTQLVLNAYRVPRIFQTPKDTAIFPQYTPALQTSMYEETRRFVEDVLWTRQAPLRELLTSRSTFVDSALATLYGVAGPAPSAGFAPAQLPEQRSGLLTQASVLSVLSRTDKTSVVARGLFIRGALLCLPKVPSPPAEVQAQVAAQLDADATQQELAAYRAMTSPCNGCHIGFDRLGLLMEAFDPIGRLRSEPVTPVDLTGLGAFQGVTSSAAELATKVGQDGQFVRCLSERTLAYALTTAYEAGGACASDPLHTAVEQGGGTLKALVSAIVAQPTFHQRAN